MHHFGGVVRYHDPIPDELHRLRLHSLPTYGLHRCFLPGQLATRCYQLIVQYQEQITSEEDLGRERTEKVKEESRGH